MTNKVYRSYAEPIREGLTWEELWRGPDKRMIICWEVGRKIRQEQPELAYKAMDGELPELGWKGGVEKSTKKAVKYGTLRYLAQWQGLRGEDLNIDLDEEPELICSKTGVKVIFTEDIKKYGNA